MAIIQPFVADNYSAVKTILEEANLFDNTWDSEENLAGLIEKDPNSVLVARDDQKIVGVVYLIPFGPKVGWIWRLAVKTEYRRRGIASKLIETAESILRENGAVEIGLYVDASNVDLQNFYQKKNFHFSAGKSYSYLWK